MQFVSTNDSRLSTTYYFPAFHHKSVNQAGNSLFLLPMEVTGEMIDNLANLARLRFSEEEKADIKNDLQRMIAFVEKLQEVDTTGTEPLLHMTDSMNVYREDEVKGSMQKETALANAPSPNNDYFKVPKVIKK
jgi:aspartyl-tRNA(Asn)/glutamyl-tRNA(Gln) amidotransferase subunit C